MMRLLALPALLCAASIAAGLGAVSVLCSLWRFARRQPPPFADAIRRDIDAELADAADDPQWNGSWSRHVGSC